MSTLQRNATLPSAQSSLTGPPVVSAGALQCLALLLVLALALWVAATQVVVSPSAVPANPAPAEFSGARAMQHLRIIASAPHAVGSPAQARVREYILREIKALGLEPVTHNTTGAVTNGAGVFASGLHNILVRIPGTQSTGAVAVMAHYDSQPNTAGASDNGAAVAGILESMRAVQAGPRLRNDLIFILTDAEEVDAQGADAFFWQHPWAKDIRLLVNFEAAGNSGPSLLLETSPGNRGLAEGFVRAVPHPLAYSFMTQLLTAMPIGTDMTVFVENGVPSLSPMYGWNYHILYHSMLDNPDNVDVRSVQQQGENALGLARTFGSQDLASLNTREDLVFFSPWAGLVVQYPAGWAMPLAVLLGVLFLGVVIAGLRRGQLSLRGILGGLVVALAGVVVPVLAVVLAWAVVARLHPEYWRNLMGSPYSADVYLAGLAALVAAVSLTLFVLARRKLAAAHLTLGALAVWLVLALLTASALPGMSYLFTWPALATVLLVGAQVVWPEAALGAVRGRVGWAWPAGLAIAAAVTILVVIPIVALLYLFIGFWFLTMQMSTPFIAAPMLLVALMLGLLAPQADLLTRSRKWLAPGLAALAAIGFLALAGMTSGFGPSQPMQNGVWYDLNADTGQAAWYSYGERPADTWTAQFFPGSVEPVQMADVYAGTGGDMLPPGGFKGAAPAASFLAPELSVVSDEVAGGVRMLRLHLASPRLARGLRVAVSGAPVLAAAVNGNRQADSRWAGRRDWYLRYYGVTAAGVDLALEVRPGQPLALVVTDQSDGLPELPGVTYTPRSPSMMPFEIAQEFMPYPETASVSKTFAVP